MAVNQPTNYLQNLDIMNLAECLAKILLIYSGTLQTVKIKCIKFSSQILQEINFWISMNTLKKCVKKGYLKNTGI